MYNDDTHEIQQNYHRQKQEILLKTYFKWLKHLYNYNKRVWKDIDMKD